MSAAHAAGRHSMFSVFRNRDFTLLWSAQTISEFGTGITSIAASILVFRATGSAMSQQFQMRNLGRRVLDFKAVNHEVKELLPAVENQVARQGSEIMKEGATDGKRLSQQPIFMVGNVQSRVNKKSQQIEGK